MNAHFFALHQKKKKKCVMCIANRRKREMNASIEDNKKALTAVTTKTMIQVCGLKSRENWKSILTADTTMILFQYFAFWLKESAKRRARQKNRTKTVSNSRKSTIALHSIFNRFGKLIFLLSFNVSFRWLFSISIMSICLLSIFAIHFASSFVLSFSTSVSCALILLDIQTPNRFRS